MPDFYTTAQWSRRLHQEWNILSFMVWLHRENRGEIQDNLGISGSQGLVTVLKEQKIKHLDESKLFLIEM